jgi:outer membrane PBP1 activator LpoA protein
MAFALCGHFDAAEQAITTLEQLHANSLPVTHYGTVELRAAIAIGKKDPAKALNLLDKVELQSDPSLLPYLRSRAYAGLGEPQQIAENLRSIEDHRGAVYLTGISVYSQAKREYDQTSSPQQVALHR